MITIGEDTYTVKFSMLSQFILDEAGIGPNELKVLGAETSRPGKVSLMFKLFAAGVAHHFVNQNQPVPSAAQWAARLGEDPDHIFKMICEAVVAAIKKAPSPAAAAEAPPKPAASEAIN